MERRNLVEGFPEPCTPLTEDLILKGPPSLNLSALFWGRKSRLRYETELSSWLESKKSALYACALGESPTPLIALLSPILKEWQVLWTPALKGAALSAFWISLLKRSLNRLENGDSSLAQSRLQDLLKGIEVSSTPSLERNLKFLRLAIRNDAPVESYLRTCRELHDFSLPMLQLRSEEIGILIEDFITAFGHRATHEGELETETLHQNPSLLLSLLQLSEFEHTLPAPTPASNFYSGIRLRWIEFLLSRSHELSSFTERCRDHEARFLELLRSTFLRLGEEFEKTGAVETKADIFYFRFHELLALKTFNGDFWQLILDRRANLYERRNPLELKSQLNPESLNPLHGTGIAGESLIGEAICVPALSFQAPLGNLNGKILITRSLSPGYGPELIRLKGLITEQEPIHSDSGVLCREYGIPSIAGVKRACHSIKTGDWIKIDPLKGTVELLTKKPDK